MPDKTFSATMGASWGTKDHQKLKNRDAPDQHPIKAVKGLSLELDSLKKIAQENKRNIELERARIDVLATMPEGATTNDAELADIRVGSDGAVYHSAGEAVRVQTKQLGDALYETYVGKTKEQCLAEYEVFATGYLEAGGTYGKHISALSHTTDAAPYSLKIDVTGFSSVRFPIYKTTSRYGSVILNSAGVVIATIINETMETGSIMEIALPSDAAYMLLSISTTLAETDWTFAGFTYRLKSGSDDVTVFSKNGTVQYILAENMVLYVRGIIGNNLNNVPMPGLGGAKILKIDVSQHNAIEYPVFKSSEYNGSLIVDENDIVIYAYSEAVAETGSTKTLILPTGSKYALISISATLDALDWSVKLYKTIPNTVINTALASRAETGAPNMFTNENRDLCLGAIKTDILDKMIPYHRGFLFHKLSNDDKSIWYGTNFNNASKVGSVSFYPKDCVLAISPKDGRLIATTRGKRGAMYVWDGRETFTLFSDADLKPMGWLYNAGVDFVNDADGIEHCIFAEYAGNNVDSAAGFYIWRGTYPYTSKDNWERVFYQHYEGNTTDYDNCITHFHQVRRDPWTNILYLTSGDTSAYCKWWYSTDYGVNWTLLTTGAISGWEENTCRCINFIFTNDYIYWATDKGTNHTLNRIKRNAETGIIDISTREKLCDLPTGCATNSICYVDSPKGIFMYDRVDIGYTDYYDKGIDIQFWSLETNELVTLMHLDLISSDWGGHRGKCYVNYTNSNEYRPAMGFSDDTRCRFDIVRPNSSDIGTVFYDVGAKTIRTLQY